MTVEFVAVILASSSGSRLYPLTVDAHEDDDDYDDETQKEDKILSMDDDEDDDAVKIHNRPRQGHSTGSFMPKHLLPIAGTPNIFHLLRRLKHRDFQYVILTLSTHDDDSITLRALTEPSLGFGATILHMGTVGASTDAIHSTVTLEYQGMNIYLVRLNVECSGSAEVLRILSPSVNHPAVHTNTFWIPQSAHIMILPGDLFVTPLSLMTDTYQEDDPIILLADSHRKAAFPNHLLHTQQQQQGHPGKNGNIPAIPPPPTAAITMLLTNVGEEDEAGIPLKESAKIKKGGLAREDQDIEYIALTHIQHLHHIPTLTTSTPSLTTSSSSTLPLINQTISSSSFAPILSFATKAVPQRVILKTSKFSIEEDEENTGSTPKLRIPKARFHATYMYHTMSPSAKSSFSIRNDWSDIHAYVFSPWILHLLQSRPTIKDIQKDLIPLLISRQFKGVKATFLGTSFDTLHCGSGSEKENRKALLDQLLAQDPTFLCSHNNPPEERNHPITNEDGRKSTMSSVLSTTSLNSSMMASSTSATSPTVHTLPSTASIHRDDHQDFPYLVNAQVLTRAISKLTLRACTIPSYLYACREMASRYCLMSDVAAVNIKNQTLPSSSSSSTTTATYFETLPKGSIIDRKTQSILLPDVSLADKVQIKSCTLGARSKVGAKSRLNNVVIMDDVVIGENCVLQNSVVSSHCIIGENSNLNDCQVGPKAVVSPGTKAKGESFT